MKPAGSRSRWGAAPEAAEVNLEVTGPGGPLTVFRVPVRSDIALDVPPAGGGVSIHGDDSVLQLARAGRLWLVHENGGILSARRGQVDSRAPHDPGVVLMWSNLMPGNWRLVRLQREAPTLGAIGAIGSTIATWSLAPGDNVTVTVPE